MTNRSESPTRVVDAYYGRIITDSHLVEIFGEEGLQNVVEAGTADAREKIRDGQAVAVVNFAERIGEEIVSMRALFDFDGEGALESIQLKELGVSQSSRKAAPSTEIEPATRLVVRYERSFELSYREFVLLYRDMDLWIMALVPEDLKVALLDALTFQRFSRIRPEVRIGVVDRYDRVVSVAFFEESEGVFLVQPARKDEEPEPDQKK